jgi:hypothetical protein
MTDAEMEAIRDELRADDSPPAAWPRVVITALLAELDRLRPLREAALQLFADPRAKPPFSMIPLNALAELYAAARAYAAPTGGAPDTKDPAGGSSLAKRPAAWPAPHVGEGEESRRFSSAPAPAAGVPQEVVTRITDVLMERFPLTDEEKAGNSSVPFVRRIHAAEAVVRVLASAPAAGVPQDECDGGVTLDEATEGLSCVKCGEVLAEPERIPRASEPTPSDPETRGE